MDNVAQIYHDNNMDNATTVKVKLSELKHIVDSERVCRKRCTDEYQRFCVWLEQRKALTLEDVSIGNDILKAYGLEFEALGSILNAAAELSSLYLESSLQLIHEYPLQERVEWIDFISNCISRLFRLMQLLTQQSTLVQYLQLDDRLDASDEADLAKEGIIFPKLIEDEYDWLRKRLWRVFMSGHSTEPRIVPVESHEFQTPTQHPDFDDFFTAMNIPRISSIVDLKIQSFSSSKYVCTFQTCNAKSFTLVDDWFEHEMRQHRIRYLCPLCDRIDFENESAYQQHLEKEHKQLLDLGMEDSLTELSKTPLDCIASKDCPFCYQWPKFSEATGGTPGDFKDHMRLHFELLALHVAHWQADKRAPIRLQSLTTSRDAGKRHLLSEDFEERQVFEGQFPEESSSTLMRPTYLLRIDEIHQHEDATDIFDKEGAWLPHTTPGYNQRDAPGRGITGQVWCYNGKTLGVQPNRLSPSVTHYSTTSVFYCSGYGFRVLKGDATSPPLNAHWQPIKFDHHPMNYSSHLSHTGTEHSMRVHNPTMNWHNVLLPNIYHGRAYPYEPYGGICGDLSLFLALVALSMDPEKLEKQLPMLVQEGSWLVPKDKAGNGWHHKRGVVVSVYVYPGTEENIKAYECTKYYG